MVVGVLGSVATALDETTGVGSLTFERGRNNFLTTDLLDCIVTGLDDLARKGCRAVVLRSGAEHFCAGVDVTDGASATREGAPHLYDLVPVLIAQPLPVVAAVRGASVGGGLGLALAADFRVTCAEARFSANFARLGFSQGFALSLTLPAVVGRQRAAELLYTGRRIDGTTAVEIGLCDRLVAADQVENEAAQLAAEIAGSAPLAVATMRRMLREDLVTEVSRTLKRERQEQDALMRTVDFKEGLRASKHRREPEFQGA